MLLEIAIGDAFGAGYEFCTPTLTELGSYKQHPRHHTIRPGNYTDDTQMSLAVAETLLAGNLTPLQFANYFVRCFHRDPRHGYASRFHTFLEKTADGEKFIGTIQPVSNKCGAAMRSVPLGLLDLPTLLKVAPMQAALTHNQEGQDSSTIVALAAHYLRSGQTKNGLPAFIRGHFPGYSDLFNMDAFVDGKAIPTISAALTGLLRHDSSAELLLWCINLGGDVDSVAAIAMGLASLNSQETAQDLPSYLFYQLENKTYGRDYLLEIDQKLEQTFPLT